MIITFPRIKAAGYAIGKRLQGYHLLQNPKGTPQTEVNMLKTKDDFSIFFDDMFSYEKLTKNFADSETKEVKRTLNSIHYFDVDKKQMTEPRKKDLMFVMEKDGVNPTYAKRDDFSINEFVERKEPFGLSDSKYYNLRQQKRDKAMDRRYYKTEYSLFQKIVALGMHRGTFYPQENRPNFFKVLYHNLTNKV